MRPTGLPRLLLAALACLPLSSVADPIAYGVGFRDLYRVDLATGSHSRIGAVGFNDIEGLALVGPGQLFGAVDGTQGSGGTASDFLIRIDIGNGQGSLVGALTGLAGQGPEGQLDYGLAATCDGRLWMSSETTQELWEVNRLNGGVRRVGVTGASLSGLAGRGQWLYGVSVGTEPALFRVDPETAATQRIGALGPAAQIPGGQVENVGLDFDSAGNLWATLDPRDPSRPTRVVRVDVSSGSAVFTSSIQLDVGIKGLAIAPPPACQGGTQEPAATPVPGPAGGVLALLAALMAIVGARAAARRA